MVQSIKTAADAVLNKAVNSNPGVPGVVAVATDRNANIYEGALGVRQAGANEAMTIDSVFAIFSTTKAITGTACLQLVEDGKLDLDAPAKTYAPEIGKLQVLDGFDDAGKPKLRAPKREVTTRMLLLHTAGFAYDFFNETYNRLAQDHKQPSVITASHASIRTPLLFDPGEKWEYGSNMDWAGQVVEGIAGKRLGEVMKDRIFKPLGMEDTAFSMNEAMRKRMVTMHQRDETGKLTPLPDFTLPPDPEVHMGGHGLYSTVLDYAKRQVHPNVVERRPRTGRTRPQKGNGRDGGQERSSGGHENQGIARRNPEPFQLRRVLPRNAEVLGADVHDQRPGRSNRPAGRRARLGGAPQSLLLD